MVGETPFQKEKGRCVAPGVGECLKSGSSSAASVAQAGGGEGRGGHEAGRVQGLGCCWVLEGPAGCCEDVGAAVLRRDLRGPGRGLFQECRPQTAGPGC